MENWSRLEHIFHEAMEKPNARRRAYLLDVCETQEELEKALEFVSASEATDDFMSTSIGLPHFSPSLTSGAVLGNWRIDKIIGSGGMGEVYLVRRETDDYKHVAALKLARTKDEKYLARFEQERKILAKLEHANIGRLIDGGVNDNEQPYFVMEYVNGQTITEYAQSHKLGYKPRLKLFGQLCRALSHAHARLVLHRDIKPANVLVSTEGEVKLIDFGVADRLDSTLTFGSVPTTKAYAAPEQLFDGQITTATDIFSLGGLLHKLLTDKRLNIEDNIAANLPEDLRHIIRKSRQKNPDDRYESVNALMADIKRFENSEPVEARNGGWPYRAIKFLSRYKIAATISALLVFSLIAGLGGTLSMLKRAQISEKIAQIAQLDEEYEARLADGYRIGLQTLYGEDKAPEDRIDPKLIDKSVLNMALNTKETFDLTNLDDAFLLFSMGKLFKYREDFENAVSLLSPLEDMPLTTPIMAYLSIESRSELARCLIQVNEKKRAEKIARQLLVDRVTHHLTNTQTHVQDAQSIAKVTGDIVDQNFVIELTKQSIDIELQKTEPSDSSLEYFYNQLAFTLYRRGQIMESLEFFEKSYEMQRKQGIRFLDDAAAPTNLAQFQIYLAQDGEKPEKYLPDYLAITSGEQGSPTLYSLVQGLRAEAALLTERWDVAEETSRLAMEKIENNKKFRAGWYYDIVVARMRALTRLARYGEARGLLAPSLSALGKEDIVSRWEFKECKLYLAEAYLVAFEDSKERAV
ncbi:MAG: hypothetical protein COA43_14330 [Robiginitomaculum sp.]|nr:MAG: hypothetical protein COA43_14330 [Robiginitomaculum sp.]